MRRPALGWRGEWLQRAVRLRARVAGPGSAGLPARERGAREHRRDSGDREDERRAPHRLSRPRSPGDDMEVHGEHGSLAGIRSTFTHAHPHAEPARPVPADVGVAQSPAHRRNVMGRAARASGADLRHMRRRGPAFASLIDSLDAQRCRRQLHLRGLPTTRIGRNQRHGRGPLSSERPRGSLRSRSSPNLTRSELSSRTLGHAAVLQPRWT